VEKEFPGRKVFGLVLPTVLAIPTNDPIAVFATPRTVESHAFKEEIFRQASGGSILPMVIEVSLPELASRIEHGENVREYIGSFNTPSIEDAKTGVLCCTHYGIVREDFMHAFPQIKKWISQEEIIPPFFATYLNEKKEFADTLAHDGVLEVYVSKESAVFNEWLLKWYGEAVEVNVVTL
jgi:glutamate racemase